MITIKSTKYSKSDTAFCIDVLHYGLHQCCVYFGNEKVLGDHYCDNCKCKLACTELKSAYHHMQAKRLRAEAVDQLDIITLEDLEFLDS